MEQINPAVGMVIDHPQNDGRSIKQKPQIEKTPAAPDEPLSYSKRYSDFVEERLASPTAGRR